jgi:alkanesulfonate monooxygenase SsuD/methylene tetrahydromethanopterin reductase-like flavin-dependent oxidoreductase (luciferase family)
MAIMLLRAGRLIAVPSVEAAIGYLTEEAGSPDAGPKSRRMVTGAPESVRREIEAIAREYGADEVMIVTITHDHQCRRRSYELIAQAFGLHPAGGGS